MSIDNLVGKYLFEARAEASAYLKSVYKKQDMITKEEVEKLENTLKALSFDSKFIISQQLKGAPKTEGNPLGLGYNYIHINNKDSLKNPIKGDDSIVKTVKSTLEKNGWDIIDDKKSDQGTWSVFFKRK